MSDQQQFTAELLAKILYQETQRMEKFKKQAEHFKKMDAIYGYGAWPQVCLRFNRMTKCSHLKGVLYDGQREHKYQLSRPKETRDYNVSLHVFIDKTARIRCLNGCGWEVWNTPDFKFKWEEGMQMVKHSSNTRTTSEIPLEVPELVRW